MIEDWIVQNIPPFMNKEFTIALDCSQGNRVRGVLLL